MKKSVKEIIFLLWLLIVISFSTTLVYAAPFSLYGTVSYDGVPTNNINVAVSRAGPVPVTILNTTKTNIDGTYQFNLDSYNLQSGEVLNVFASHLPYYALKNFTYSGTDSSAQVNLNIIQSEESMVSIIINGTVNDGNVDTPPISDTMPPLITILGYNPVSVNVGDIYTDAGAIAFDDVDGFVEVQTANAVNMSSAGFYRVTYNATDVAGNVVTATRIVIVKDVPIIQELTSASITPVSSTITAGNYQFLVVNTLDQFSNPIKKGITVEWSSDNPNIARVVLYSNTVRAVSPGTATLTAAISDGRNTLTEDITVNVVALIPEIAAVHVEPDKAALKIGDTFQFTAEARDADNNPVASTAIVTWAMKDNDTTVGNVDGNGLFTAFADGTATIIATMGGISGEADVIVDTVPPIITISGENPVIITAGSIYVDAEATAFDEIDGDLTASITATSNVGTAIGNYTIIYEVSDMAGNLAAPVTRIVHVVAPATLTVGNVEGVPGDVVAVPIQIIQSGDTSAFNLDIIYDTQILEAGALNANGGIDYIERAGTLTSNYDLFLVNGNMPGKIQIAAASLNPTTSSGILMKVLFTIKAGAVGSDIINLSLPNDLGNDLRNAKVIAGTVNVIELQPIIDDDADGVQDGEDFIEGTFNNITSNFKGRMKIVDPISGNLSVNPNNHRGSGRVEFEDEDNQTVVEFEYEFSNLTKLDLSKIKIIEDEYNETGSIVINGLGLSGQNKTKTVYIKNKKNTATICIKDAEVQTISNVSSDCKSVNERIISCDGFIQSDYSCTSVNNGTHYKITGLRHSAVMEFTPIVAVSSSDSSIDGGGASRGSGGGYSSSRRTMQTPQQMQSSDNQDSFESQETIDLENSGDAQSTESSRRSGITGAILGAFDSPGNIVFVGASIATIVVGFAVVHFFRKR